MLYSTLIAPQTVLRQSVTISIGSNWFACRVVITQSPSVPWLSNDSHKLIDSSEERKKREEGRSKMIEKMNKNLREPDIFKNGEIAYIQDENGKWTVRATVLNRRKHQGIESSLYMLKKSKTGHITCRNERAIRRFTGDSPDNKTG